MDECGQSRVDRFLSLIPALAWLWGCIFYTKLQIICYKRFTIINIGHIAQLTQCTMAVVKKWNWTFTTVDRVFTKTVLLWHQKKSNKIFKISALNALGKTNVCKISCTYLSSNVNVTASYCWWFNGRWKVSGSHKPRGFILLMSVYFWRHFHQDQMTDITSIHRAVPLT